MYQIHSPVARVTWTTQRSFLGLPFKRSACHPLHSGRAACSPAEIHQSRNRGFDSTTHRRVPLLGCLPTSTRRRVPGSPPTPHPASGRGLANDALRVACCVLLAGPFHGSSRVPFSRPPIGSKARRGAGGVCERAMVSFFWEYTMYPNRPARTTLQHVLPLLASPSQHTLRSVSRVPSTRFCCPDRNTICPTEQAVL